MVFSQKYTSCLYYALIIGCCYSCKAQEKTTQIAYEHPIPFAPETYVCHFTKEAITIDGKDTESSWIKTSWSNEFVDIEGDLKPNPTHPTHVKMLWDSTYFYFFAKMEEPHIWATLKNRDDIVYHDDDFEIFIDPDGDSHNYYEFEWNAINTLWDLILLKPYRADNLPKVLFEWNVTDVKSAVHIEGTLNDASDEDEFWTIEIAIPWFALNELSPESHRPGDGVQWRVNFSRVDWTMDNDGKDYTKRLTASGEKIPPDNWVWSPTGRINMHMPEMWGFVKFSNAPPSQHSHEFDISNDEKIKWALWNMYWQQINYKKKNRKFMTQLEQFAIPKVDNCSFEPSLFTTPYSFEISNPSFDKKGHWVIQNDGKIYLHTK